MDERGDDIEGGGGGGGGWGFLHSIAFRFSMVLCVCAIYYSMSKLFLSFLLDLDINQVGPISLNKFD